MDIGNLYNRVDKIVTIVTQVLVIALFVGMVVLVFAQVYTRFFTNSSLTWSEELSRFLMIWMVFLASSLAFKQGAHITVENIVNALPEKIRWVTRLAANTLMLIFLFILLWGAYKVLPTTALQISPANSIKMSYIYAAIPVSALLTMPEVIRRLVNTLLRREEKTA